jgi:branched-chain amino acid transport system permease protein
MRFFQKKIVIPTLIVAFLFFLPLFFKGEYYLNMLCTLFLYVILSESWNILGGYTGQINVGQAAFFGIGALVTRLLWTSGIPFVPALLGGGLSSVILSLLIGIPALRLRGHYFAIGTLSVAWIALITIENIFPGVTFLPGKYVATYSLLPRYYAFLIILLSAVIVISLAVHSRMGLAMESIRDDEEAAQAAGVNIFKYKVIAFVISSFFAGLAGGGFSFFHVSYYWYMPFALMWCFEPILITFIGGVGTIWGPIIGSLCYVALKESFALTMGEINVLIFGVVFIFIILFFPKGIIGIPEKIREHLTKRMGANVGGDVLGKSQP